MSAAASVRAISCLLGAAVTCFPGWVLACPACANRGGFGLETAAVLGGMVAVPFVIAAVAINAISRLDSDSRR